MARLIVVVIAILVIVFLLVKDTKKKSEQTIKIEDPLQWLDVLEYHKYKSIPTSIKEMEGMTGKKI